MIFYRCLKSTDRCRLLAGVNCSIFNQTKLKNVWVGWGCAENILVYWQPGGTLGWRGQRTGFSFWFALSKRWQSRIPIYVDVIEEKLKSWETVQLFVALLGAGRRESAPWIRRCGYHVLLKNGTGRSENLTFKLWEFFPNGYYDVFRCFSVACSCRASRCASEDFPLGRRVLLPDNEQYLSWQPQRLPQWRGESGKNGEKRQKRQSVGVISDPLLLSGPDHRVSHTVEFLWREGKWESPAWSHFQLSPFIISFIPLLKNSNGWLEMLDFNYKKSIIYRKHLHSVTDWKDTLFFLQ